MNGHHDSEVVAHNRTRCQTARVLVDGSNRKQGMPCPNRAEPGSMYCATCRQIAWARVASVKRA